MGLKSCPWAGQCHTQPHRPKLPGRVLLEEDHTQPHRPKLPWGEGLPSLAEYGWKRRKVVCCGHHVCPSCQRGRWGTVGLQRSGTVRNWARFQLQWGLVRLNHERCLAEVGGGHAGAGGAEGGEGCFLGTVLFLLESQNVFWKADVSCGKTELLCSGSLWFSPPCWWQCRN